MASRNGAVRPDPDGDVEQNTSNVQAKATSNVQAKVKTFFKDHSAAMIWLLSVMAVAFDPFFFYIPVVKNASTCLGFDNNLRIAIVVLRSFVDVLHPILWWHYSLPLVKRRCRGQKPQKYPIMLAQTVAIVASLPLPQVVILAVSWQLFTVKLLKFIVLIQFFIRLYRIIPAHKDATRNPDMLLTHTWFAALFNLIMYTIASNVLGAFWYLRAVERNIDCWKGACHKNQTSCFGSSLYCDPTSTYNGFLHEHCSILQASSTKSFDYGIYDEAFQTIIIKTDIHFLDKFWQCFWWGLRNMSSLGQNLKTGTYIWDTFFAVVIATCGLILFAFFIGNMQTYLQTQIPAKLEKMKLKASHLKEWNLFNVLPGDLKDDVKSCEDPRWLATTEVNLESLLQNTPTELSKGVKSCLCKAMLETVLGFAHLNDLLWEELCHYAKPVVYPERSYIHRKEDLATEMILILHGDLFSYLENEVNLHPHHASKDNYLYFGEELIQHWLPPIGDTTRTYALGFPITRRAIKAVTKVEAFVISKIDLDIVLQKFCSPLDLNRPEGNM